MPQVTFNFTNAQQARVVQATNVYNALTGSSLTPKQWVALQIKNAVRNICFSLDVKTDQETLLTQYEGIEASAQAVLDTDMAGDL